MNLRCCVCRKPFFAKRKDARTCSERCRKRAQRKAGTNVPDIIPAKALSLKPIGIGAANDFVRLHHRHNKEVKIGSRFALAVTDDAGQIWGVAIVSHPVARLLNGNGFTGEVRRCCTRLGALGGCCSMLYSACWRVGKAMGGTRMVTYTLQSESGASLKASGWVRVGARKGHKVQSKLGHASSARQSGWHGNASQKVAMGSFLGISPEIWRYGGDISRNRET
jgi:hypothetical protein